MKSSFVQIFDKKADAMRALGFIRESYPDHQHSLVDSSHQVQVWTTFGGTSASKTYGAPDADVIYMVLSIAQG